MLFFNQKCAIIKIFLNSSILLFPVEIMYLFIAHLTFKLYFFEFYIIFDAYGFSIIPITN